MKHIAKLSAGERLTPAGATAACLRLVLGITLGALTALTVLPGWPAWGAGDSPAATASYDWSGFYAGGHSGYGWGNSHFAAQGTAAPGSLDLFNRSGGELGGFQAGYNLILPRSLLLGIDGDLSFPRELNGDVTLSSATSGIAQYRESIQYSGTLRGRLGYVGDHWLLYATGGFGASYDEFTRTQIAGGAVPPGIAGSFKKTRLGWTAGGGIEIPFAPSWTAQLQYLFSDFGAHTVAFSEGAQHIRSDFASNDVRLAFNYKLDGEGSLPPSPPQLDWFSLHGQTTFVTQGYGPFRAAFDGPQSLARSGQNKETFDASPSLGLKPWAGAEIWIDPEIDQGFGPQNTLGLAAFASGEAYKVGAYDPYMRLPRIFLRQTIDLGGNTEKVEADASHFAGTQTADRIVLTVGRFSAPDIFDTNKYAHDPRGDFLNWAIVDAGTYDYAADAWGYTWGAAAEWYSGRWTLRAGIFDLSIVPNSTVLDPSWRQFQPVLEVEERHDVLGQPGSLKVTGFLTHGRMGEFADAIKLAELTGGQPSTAAVRRFNDRTGINLNLEQQIAPGIGFFARTGVADGNIEPFEFTDIDRTVSGGFAFSGQLWGREGDIAGLAGVVNGISKVHQTFLSAGGLGILVGDGTLPHPGNEKIIEAYYSVPFASWRITFDYQLAVNPGYNEDRGPISIFGGRLHTQF